MTKKITVDGRSAALWAWIITFALPIALLLIPVTEVFTAPIRSYLAITLWMILAVAFDLFNPLIPGVLVSVLYYVCGVAPANVAFGCWTQEMAYTLLGCFVMAAALDECGLTKRIAYGAVIKLGGNFTGVVWGVYVGTVLVAAITFCNAFALAAILVVGICRSLQLKPNSKEGSIIMIVGLTGVVGCRNFIYAPGASGVVTSGFRQIVPDFGFGVGEYMLHNIPHVLFAVFFVFLLTKIYKTKNMKPLGSLEEIKAQYEALGKFKDSKREKKAAVVTVLIVAYIIACGFTGWNMNYAFMVAPFLYFFPGIEVATSKAIKSVDMGMTILTIAFLGLGTVGVYLGLGDLIVSILSPILQNVSPTMAILGIILICYAANFIMTPLGIMAALAVPLASLAVNIGINPLSAAYTLVQSTDYILLPYESGPSILFFAYGFWSMKDFIKVNTLKFVLYLVFMVVAVIPWWNLMGVI